MEKEIRIMATGDSFIAQRLACESTNLDQVRTLLNQADVRFTNLEVTIHDYDVYPSAVSGGTWAAARPAVLKDLRWLGFNLMACANNHTLDWSHHGLLKTLEHLEREDWIYAGVGRNLTEANQPKFFETKHGRVALVAVTSTVPDWHLAGEQRPDLLGRPGVNALRYRSTHYVSKQDFAQLKRTLLTMEGNAQRMIQLSHSDEELSLGDLSFREGVAGRTETVMNQKDAKRIGHSIRSAAQQADVVLVSHHAHEKKGESSEQPADFLQEFARFCIDQGAHAYLGHGPHVLRGIEVYKNAPIFYSLGNFIFQNETVEKQPSEFFDRYGLGAEHVPMDAYLARSDHGTKGLSVMRDNYLSVIASIVMEAGALKTIELHPVSLGFDLPRSRKGVPALADWQEKEEILDKLQHLSQQFGTTLHKQNGIGIIEVGR
ncbi:hypothetical protein CIG75_15130 [Tumebacillus algifaecis]|uniref:Capsule synthesis protein CapA domain-containing protein n=1 Tax=Tumebacillus algifaecis TaxID=1214604 RepID=A0A223D3Z0_9BACL|nr:CapA family protein [Tumebacillus algifaecis]ASS76143.1 hypothetical protein CIG75_15130 [Tumebacillus algifaecis]